MNNGCKFKKELLLKKEQLPNVKNKNRTILQANIRKKILKKIKC